VLSQHFHISFDDNSLVGRFIVVILENRKGKGLHVDKWALENFFEMDADFLIIK
jgi:hypothetical protein